MDQNTQDTQNTEPPVTKKQRTTTTAAAATGGSSKKTCSTTVSPYFDKQKEVDVEVEVVKNNMDTKNMNINQTEKSKPKSKISKSKKNENDKTRRKKRTAVAAVAVAGRPDGNGGLDQGTPFMIEYAATGRSTCKRCDIKIKKDEVRVGHRPLFRGKPGFCIFKHLHCIVFSEEIQCAEDVSGFDELSDEDYEALRSRICESREEIKLESQELDADELVQKAFDGEIREAPKGLNATLLPFQKEGVSWMYCQEVNVPEIRGGILADEMGMGKTLQSIATILDNRPKLQHSLPGAKYPPLSDEEKKLFQREDGLWNDAVKLWKHEMDMNDIPSSILPRKKKNEPGGGARAGTLVICPMIALYQWKSEIEKFSDHQALSVCIYHGPDRDKNLPRELLRKFDVVLTTYQVLEQDFRKMVSPNKVKCPNCGGKFKVDKLKVHLKYFCGEGAQRTEAQARTRRNTERGDNDESDRRGNGNGNSNGNGSRGNKGKNSKNNTSQKKEDSKKGYSKKDEAAKTPVKGEKVVNKKTSKKRTTAAKKKQDKQVLKLKGDGGYDSESDLSIQSESSQIGKTRRPRRTAATKAKNRLAGQAKKDIKRRSSFGSSDEDYVESDVCDDTSDVSSEEDEVIMRAKKKQAMALAKSKKFGKKVDEKKSFSSKKGAKKKGSKSLKGKDAKKKVGTKKTDDSSSDFSSSSSDSDGGVSDIDMDALIAEAMAGARMSVLHSLCWWRIVLDEAHFIKSRSSQTSAAAFALIGIHRWCLSGTPLQNRVGEFYSLVRFLRLDPMAHYFCRAKDCTCKQVHYRMLNGRCKDCGHSSIQHYSHFNRKILNPIQRDGYANDGRRAMFILKNDILDKCLFRRTKETQAADMNLPPRIVTIKSVRLHPVEEDFYNSVYTHTAASFNDYVTDGTLLNNYAHIFDLLMRMRQSVCHPYLVVYSKKDIAKRSAETSAVSNGTVDCHLCHEPPTERVLSTCCQTAFCKGCVIEYMETSVGIGGENGMTCPCCRSAFTIDLNQVEEAANDVSTLSIGNGKSVSRIGLPSLQELPHVATGSILRRIDLTKFATSSKIEALTKELVDMRKGSPGSKAIVFSQFVNMLDLIRWRLHSDPYLAELGLGVRALHGGMDVKSRDVVLNDFKDDCNVRVLLMSLKAGGVALNLTVANHIYLMDPWWNPAAEMQAIDRTHRLGQHRPIRAIRFIAEDTVEERILQLQDKKRLVFDGTVGRDAGSLKMLTVEDMKSLFG